MRDNSRPLPPAPGRTRRGVVFARVAAVVVALVGAVPVRW